MTTAKQTKVIAYAKCVLKKQTFKYAPFICETRCVCIRAHFLNNLIYLFQIDQPFFLTVLNTKILYPA